MNKSYTVCSLNINGLNSRQKKSYLKQWVSQHKPDVLVLVDTRLTASPSLLAKGLGASSCTMSATSTRPGGIAILTFSGLFPTVTVTHSAHSLLCVNLQSESLSLSIIGVYVPATSSERISFLQGPLPSLFSSFTSSDNVILCGDFNFVEVPSLDKSSGSGSHGSLERTAFASIKDSMDLSDAFRLLFPLKKEFTFYSASGRSSSRIDRMYLSSGLLAALLKFAHIFVPSHLSDHSFGCSCSLPCPEASFAFRNDLWRLNANNLNKPSLQRSIQQLCLIYKNSSSLPSHWWDEFKTAIKAICMRHSVVESSRRQGQIRALQHDTAILGSLALANPKDNAIRDRFHMKQSQLTSYLSDDISFQKRRISAKKGRFPPNVLKLLANLVRARKSATIIHSLSSGGRIVSSREEISNVASDFYSQLYSHSSDGLPSHPVWSTPTSSLSEEASLRLDKVFSREELFDALISLPSNSVPGMDGLPKEFYTAYWVHLAPLFLRMAEEFLQGIVPPSLLGAASVLIHKKGNKDDISNYRPISLLGTDYKILAKALSKRIVRYLPQLIHFDQSGFVRNRDISDTIYSILDTVDFCNAFNKEGFLFLLDLRKAYDTLDRQFLYGSLSHLGLSPKYIEMVKRLHENSFMRLYINGHLGPAISLSSGVRQGCPLAPQLFICAIEMFHRFANTRLPRFCLTSVPRSLACYADDITIFLPSANDLHIAKDTIYEFAEVSNELPNLDKCAIIPMGPSRDHPPDLSLQVPFVGKEDSERILGVRLSPSEDTESTWKLIVSSIRKKLQAWSSTHPSMHDRGRILNYFISPVFEFQGKFQPPPPALWKQLHHLFYNFASQNKVVDNKLLPMLWSYNALHLSIKKGGVGLISPTLRLHALTIRRVFRLLRHDHPDATYMLSVLALPLGWRSFLAHPSILKSSFPFSVRWLHDLKIFLNYFPALPPPLLSSVLLHEPLAFNRWILKGSQTPFWTAA